MPFSAVATAPCMDRPIGAASIKWHVWLIALALSAALWRAILSLFAAI